MTSAPPRTPPSSTGKGYSMLPPVPAPLQRLFDLFPLRTLPANALPAASLSFCSSPEGEGRVPALFVFTTDDAARRGAPSFNPSCLKWQTYLRARRVPHRTVPSTNHASPSGALPFLLVTPAPEIGTGPKSSPSAQQQQQQQPKYITASALPAYIASHAPAAPTAAAAAADQPAQDPRAALYAALLETAVRPAYLHALYILPANAPLMQDLYVDPSTRSRPVRASLSRQLRRAAEAEVRRAVVAASGRSPLDAEDPARLLAEARAAFAALAELLSAPTTTTSSSTAGGEEQEQQQKETSFFFGGNGQGGPGLFDASVFAYTHLLLGGELAWADRSLAQAAEEFPALVEHRRRVYEACWGRSG